jgi:hypothetical protein
MKLLRALLLLLESSFVMLSLTLQQRIREVKRKMKKQKEAPAQPSSPSPDQAPSLKLKTRHQFLKDRPGPPFPPQSKKMKKGEAPSPGGSSTTTLNSGPSELDVIPARDIRTCAAVLDLPFRGAHLIWKDIEPLTKEELEYMAEPLAEILIDLDWMDKIKGPYIKLGYGISVAVVTRLRAHEKLKAAKKKEAEKVVPVEPKKGGGAMEAGKA